MELLRRKRKVLDVLPSVSKSLIPRSIMWSRFSLGDYSRQKKKCKEDEAEVVSSRSAIKGIVTAPPCQRTTVVPPCRGLKRKIGCIDAATRFGRKKKIEQEYELGPTIGQGKFGSVVFCSSKATGEQLACKILRKGEDPVHREVEIMQHLSGHPGIVTLKAVYEDIESFYLVMELCSGGRLLDQMANEGQYSEYQAAKIVRDLISVLKYCHDMGVVHRDIKPENILLTTSGQMKLADFGLAVRMSIGQNLTGGVGSPAYVAPEVLAGDYSEKVDVWSVGVLLHALLVGVLPFQGDSLDAVFEAVKKVNLDFKTGLWELISHPAKDLVAQMLTRDVSARLTADEVLRHPWISFYAEPTVGAHTLKPQVRSHVNSTSDFLSSASGVILETYNGKTSRSFSADNSLILAFDHLTMSMKEQDCDVVDALAMAISRVRISEPKRTRLCGSGHPIQQKCSSNIKINLCTAF